MKLPDFTQDAGLNALRQAMGAPLGRLQAAENRSALTREEIEALTKQGIDVSWSDVTVLGDGTLAYKDRRVILYIRDVMQRGETFHIPRFHVADCKTLAEMRANLRGDRYVVATRDDGQFPLNIIRDNVPRSTTQRLPVCQMCLNRLSWQGFSLGQAKHVRDLAVSNFSISGFFEAYGKTLVTRPPSHSALTAPLNVYSSDFKAQADQAKALRDYRCGQCGIDLTQHRKYLHAHHKDGQKHDSSLANMTVLCIACHAEQYQHSHIKKHPDYLEFLRIKARIAGPSLSQERLQWEQKARDLAQVHGLKIIDRRKDGGAFWVSVNRQKPAIAQGLQELGFHYSAKRGGFWRKE